MKNFWKSLPKPFFVLAPMEGVTDYVFREIISQIGKPDVLFTEFTNTDALNSKGYDNAITRFYFSENQRPLVAQIWGTKPEHFFSAARIAADQGVDGIDINLGCPDKSVMKGGSGAALIDNPNLVAELISAVRESVPDIPLSIKTRLGVKSRVTEEWIPFLLSKDIQALTVHARTAKELSDVPADWDEIGRCVEYRNTISPDIVFIGNGDILSYEDGLEKHSVYKVDGLMVGRGIFSNPFFFNHNKQPTTEDLIQTLLVHTKLYEDFWYGRHNFAEMKRFFKIYVKGIRNAGKLKDQLMKTHKYSEVEEIISDFFRGENIKPKLDD